MPARSEEDLIFRLYEAMDVDQFGHAIFELVSSRIPNQLLMLFLRPGDFDLPVMLSKEEYRSATEDYIIRDHRGDIWLKRSPINPTVRVVRHSDHTPREMLRASLFYRRTLTRMHSDSGTSLVAWRGKTWLATLTIMRNEEQGDTTDAELHILETWHRHFAAALKRLARLQEKRLAAETLGLVVHALPLALVVLDWDFRPLEHNDRARHLCEQWRQGAKTGRQRRSRKLLLPGDLLAAIEAARSKLPPGALRPRPRSARSSFRLLRMDAPGLPGLSADVQFLPARALSLSRGAFVVILQEDRSRPQVSEIQPAVEQILSLREAECARLAAEGFSNTQIATRLGSSPITVRNQLSAVYRKLQVGSRHELIRRVLGNDGKAK